VGVVLLGYVSMYVLIVLFKSYCSSCGICEFVVRFIWLCLHIIDVKDGFTH
jgi:hypothetical protein